MASRDQPRFKLPADELRWRFSRSSGPGGQHVNTSDTRVELIWSVADSAALTTTQRERVLAHLNSRITDGTITITSSQYRSQHRNREAAQLRLERLVAQALIPPKARRATKPSRAANQRRLDAKKRQSERKALRRPVP